MAARFVDAISHPGQRNKVDGKRTDDTTTRWLVQKRTYFKGSYDRVLTVSQTAIATQMPNLQGTNLYCISPDFNVRSITFEKDGCLTLQAKPDNKVSLAHGVPTVGFARRLLCRRCQQSVVRTTAAG
jgi:hypothetical protein